MKEIEVKLTLYQIRANKLKNDKIYIDIFFSNSRIRSKDIDKQQFMIQETVTIKNYIGNQIELWIRDSDTRDLLGFCSFELRQGQINCHFQKDPYTEVAQVMLKSEITHTNIDREIVIENDSDFLKKVEQQDNKKEIEEEAERLRLLQLKEEQNRQANMIKISDIQLTNKFKQDFNIF